MADIATLGLRVEAGPVDKASESLDRLSSSADRAERSSGSLSKEANKSTKSLDSVARSSERADKRMSALSATAIKAGAVLGAALSISLVQRYADSWSDMQSRVGASIGDMNGAADAMSRIVDIANASYSPLEKTVEIYSRNVAVFSDLGRSAEDAANFTEAMNNALVITATKGQDADVVINSLSRALATGGLNAMDFDTIVSRSPRVLQAVADSLGVTVSGLRGLATEGKATSAVIANSLIASFDELAAEAAEMPATIGDAFTRIQTNITEFVGIIDKASGTSGALAEFILDIADGIRTAGTNIVAIGQVLGPVFETLGSAISSVAQYADIAAVALAGFYAPAVIGGIALLTKGIAVGLVGAIQAVTAALLANPIGLLVSALAAAGYAVYKFRDDISQVLGFDIGELAKYSANLLINSFVAAYEDIKFVWNNFGSIIGGAVIGGVNIAIRSINSLIQGALSGINTLVDALNNVPGIDIGRIGQSVGINEIANPYAERLAASVEERNKRIVDIMSRDYFGSGAPTIPGSVTQAGGSIPSLPGLPGSAGGALGGGTDNSADIDANAQAIKTLEQNLRLAALQGEELALAQARLSLNEYATPDQISSIEQLASALYNVQEQQDINSQATGIIDSLRTEEEAIQDSYNRRKEIILASTLATEQEKAAALIRLETETNESLLSVNGSYWERYLESARENLTSFDELSANVLENFSAQFGNAFESMVFDSESLGESIRGLAEGMARSIVNALGQMAAQWLAYQAVQLLVGRTTQASGASTLAANAQATSLQAGLAAFASTAAIPIVGPLLAPAAMASALAVTTPLAASVGAIALAGMAHDGIDSVPQTGTWLLEKGERVTTADTSARMDSVLERIDSRMRSERATSQQSSSGDTPPSNNVVLNIHNAPEGTRVEQRQLDREFIIDVMIEDGASGGKYSEFGQRRLGWRRQGS